MTDDDFDPRIPPTHFAALLLLGIACWAVIIGLI